MVRTLTNKMTAGLAAIALSLSIGLVSPAEAVNRHSTPQNTSSSVSSPVTITQVPGDTLGILQWRPVTGATEYYIYKTGSIRPTWRLFYILPRTMNTLTVSDKFGSIAIYRVMAIVNSREVFVGRVLFKPTR